MLSTVGNMVFPSHKPRDLGYGLKSGLFTIGSGVLSGATALVSLPAVGARQGGATGFAQGIRNRPGHIFGFALLGKHPLVRTRLHCSML
jgi:hypothetical protein